MGATAAVDFIAYHLTGGKKGPVGKALTGVKNAILPPAPPTPTLAALPPAPDIAAQQAEAASQMQAVMNRYRAMRSPVQSSTVLTSPTGVNTPAPTVKKGLLGL